MKKKINIQEVDFEVYLDNALKSCGYLFPETDEQISIFEKIWIKSLFQNVSILLILCLNLNVEL